MIDNIVHIDKDYRQVKEEKNPTEVNRLMKYGWEIITKVHRLKEPDVFILGRLF